MKFLIILALSALLFLGIIGRPISVNYWQKRLYNKEATEEEKKKDFIIGIILWAILTFGLIIFVIFFGKV